MKKHTKIGLMLLVTILLLLALAVPALAEPQPFEEGCRMFFPSINKSFETTDDYNLNLALPGELTVIGWEVVSGWENEILVNTCKGEVPFGEPINPGLTWIEYADLDGLGRWDYSDELATFTIYEEDDLGWAFVYDLDGSWYRSTSAYVEVDPNGEFIWYRYYNPDYTE